MFGCYQLSLLSAAVGFPVNRCILEFVYCWVRMLVSWHWTCFRSGFQMRKIWQLGAIALILGMASCNLTSAPPSSLPRVSPKPGIEKPKLKPAPTAQNPVASATNNPNLLLGNPSNAASNAASADNYLMVKPQYIVSYNSKTHTANWVSWQLNRSWIGAADRKNDFRPDDALPATWYKVRPTDYTGSGYNRGHIAPSAVAKRGVSHRTRNESDNSATFLMTNMMPQSPE